MNKIFGSKSKQVHSPGYSAPITGHRVPSPNYHDDLAEQQTQQTQHQRQQQSREVQPPLLRSASQSQRQATAQALSRPPIDVAASVNQASSLRSTDERPSEPRSSAYIPPQSPLPPHEKEQKRGFRDRLGIGHAAKHGVDPGHSSGIRASGIGRTVSVKRKEQQNPEKDYSQTQPGPLQPYSKQTSSQQRLNTQVEEEEDSQQNPYTAQQQVQRRHEQYQGPPVPSKEHSHESTYPQQPQPPQAYYTDPRSLRPVDTDHNYQAASSVELLSPADQQYLHNQSEQSTEQDQYKAFNPTDLVPSSEYQTAEGPANYSFPFQQHGQQQSGQQSQTDLHYPPVRTSLERYRPPPELQHPQASRHRHQASSSQDPLFLQPPKASSLESPPSPLAAGSSLPPYGQHASSQPPGPPSPQPPSTADSQGSSQDSMPPSGSQSQRNTARSMDKNIPPGSRDVSSLGQQGALPPAAGIQSFGSNVVPVGSQGQPYRGQGQPRQDGEHGRSTPQPEISELADEEAAAYLQLQKEYKELRDKYQKVKKYYFEKESQVHQLQNTLAHQRLSQSRTSLDDSEYAARFSRLDGLISQLSFSIRKSWKTIPDFLHRVVNKDALATGKQEMTAVGRAYFSYWIFHNVFDAFFHPDLEPGLSKDLKEVMLNIRRFCPPFQSGEEEEALTAKLINWRLTTLEGLQERLRAPEAQQYHQKLVERLNEKLLGDISLLLVDPAPPDLPGGVQMILDLAVNVAVHVPLESRDVVIEYFPPYYPIIPDVMKVDTGIPALTNAIVPTETSPSDSADRASLQSNDTKDSSMDNNDGQVPGASKDEREGRKRGMFGGLIGGGNNSKLAKQAPSGPTPSSGVKANVAQGAAGQATGGRETPTQKEERVRLAVGLAVQIRGRSVLCKAPVYTTPV